MRVTEGTMANSSLANLQRVRERIEQLYQEVSTGVRVSRPGDDPLSAQQILDLNGLLEDGKQFAKNISTGTTYLSAMESALSGMGDALVRVKELALGAANGTMGAEQRESVRGEVLQLKEQLITLGNSQINGRYVFSGFRNDVPPFDANGVYSGGDGDLRIPIDRTNTISVNYAGGKLLNGTGGGTDIIGTLDTLITALENDDIAGIQGTLSDLDDSAGQFLSARTDIGARMNRLETATGFIDDTKLYLQKVISSKQDVDFIQAVSDMTRQQTAFEAALAATSKISKISLLDYL